jgi:hypothetical protein
MGHKTINNLTIVQLRMLQKDIEKGKGVGSNLEPGSSASGSMGIKTNPLKSQKKTSGEEKRRGRKPYHQKLEENEHLW